MSNTRRARWTSAQITAASAERLLGELWAQGEAFAARTVVMRDLSARLAAEGASPGLLAALEQAAHGMGTEYWQKIYAETMAA